MKPASTLHEHLDALDDCYNAVLALTPGFAELLADRSRLDRAREDYARHGFVQLPRIVSQAALEDMARELWPVLSPLAFRVAVPHKLTGSGLTTGGQLRRVDASSLERSGQGEALANVLQAVGVAEFGRLLARRLEPLLEYILGAATYERMFFNFYDEGDYISAHDDAHMGERIDVSFPVTLDGVCGLRVLVGNFLHTYYDGDGAMSILGPRVWHEVPPLLRRQGQPAPRRLTTTMRYV